VTEKVLNYNRDLVSQETGYWCGPASAQMCLSNRGIHVDEAQLARECRTHEGGTDYLGLIENVLNQYIHDADYVTVELRNDPPLPHEVDQMWNDLRTSIDAGFGVVGNFVSPANNPPIGVKGSQSPNGYGRSTIYHYVSFHGYSQEGDFRAVWVADSGFQPSGYWVTLEQCALLCAGKGYTYARPHGAPGVPDPIGPEDAQLLSHAMGGSLSLDRYRELLPGVRDALRQSQCDNPQRIAHWFSQIGHESAGLKYMEEIADGSAYEGRQDLGNTQPGDGVRFKGHGPIQITGRHNHAAVSQWAFDNGIVPSADYFVEFPTELGSDRYGFVGAAWYWTVARGNQINAAADRGADGIGDVTRLINGGHHGLDDRTQRYHRALEVASAFLPGADYQPPPPPAPAARYWPMNSERVITSPFGPRAGGHHSGVDFGVNGGSGGKPVYAIQSGTVIQAGAAAGYGGGAPGVGWLVIDSDDSQGGGVWEYGHIVAAPGVVLGSKVTAGDMIAAINPDQATNGGCAPHLHVAYMPREYNPNRKQDPIPSLEGCLEPGAAPPPAPAPEPVPVPVPALPAPPAPDLAPSLSPHTPLTGRPFHHSQPEDLESQLLNIRAEGLLTQALVFALAERAGINARELYDNVRGSF